MEEETALLTIAFIFIGVLGFVMGLAVLDSFIDVKLSQETADEICKQLTNNSVAVGSDSTGNDNSRSGKLICSMPSFDSTQYIIVKNNDE